jgi:hypothetical protein
MRTPRRRGIPDRFADPHSALSSAAQKRVVDYASQAVVVVLTVISPTAHWPANGRHAAQEANEMSVPTTGISPTVDPNDEPMPQPSSAAPSAAAPPEATSTEVLITTQEVLFGTAAATGVRRESIGDRFVAVMRRLFATPTDVSRPRPHDEPKRYEYLERALMGREMERL